MEFSEIMTIISSIFGSGILSVVVSHILYNNKLNKEIHYKGKEKIAEIILKALTEFRDLELMIGVQELYDVENEFKNKGYHVNVFEGEIIYPAIMNDWESLTDFFNKIQEIRSNYEKYLSCRVALNLAFIDRYIQKLMLFVKEHGDEEMMHVWGLIFIVDLQKWQKRIDKILVKEINAHSYELESHETKKWAFLRKKEFIGQYEDTILYFLIENRCTRKNKKKLQDLKDCLVKSKILQEDKVSN